MSRKPRRNPGRESRSQSCFELQGNQFLHASLSSASLPPTSARPHRPPSHTLHFHDPQSSFRSLVPRADGSYKPTKSSRLRACSAPVARAQPDYRHMARRRKESILAEKTLTAEETRNTELPERETLHSFLVGGRYNSAHHVDVRSLQRLGVYVPRNRSVKTFINPAGTIPPSPAIYGLHPLRKHLPLIAGSSSAHSTDIGLALVKQDLDMQFTEEPTASRHSLTASTLTASRHSLTASRHSLHSKHSTALVTEEDNGSKPNDVIKPPTSDHDQEDINLSLKLCLTENDCGDIQPPDEETASSVVSASNLLSPEAQQLTQEILLETESVSEDGNSTTITTATATVVAQKKRSLSRHLVGSSGVGNMSRPILMLRSQSATSLRHAATQQAPLTRPKSAFKPSTVEYSDPHSNSGIFVDLSKRNQHNSADNQ